VAKILGLTPPIVGMDTVYQGAATDQFVSAVMLIDGSSDGVHLTEGFAPNMLLRTALNANIGGNWSAGDKVVVYGNGQPGMNNVVLTYVGAKNRNGVSSWSPVNCEPLLQWNSRYRFFLKGGAMNLLLPGNRGSLCPTHSSAPPESVYEHDCVCHKGYFRHWNVARNNATECWPCKANTYSGAAQHSFNTVCTECEDPRSNNGGVWQKSTQVCNVCAANASLAPPFCLCAAGSFLGPDMQCVPCVENYVCTGAYSSPVMCPAATKGLHAGEGRSMDDCVCMDGYFRADNREALDMVIAQNPMWLQDTRRLWCVPCPIGFYCKTLSTSVVNKCPASTSTLSFGATQLSQCQCVAGTFAESSEQGGALANTALACIVCKEDHYCRGGLFAGIPCPYQMISSVGATSIDKCVCLPPLIMLPAHSDDFSYDCVGPSMVTHADSSGGLTMESYNIFTVDALELYQTYATVLQTVCQSIETGFVQGCKHDIRVGTKQNSDDAIVLFRNILLDPVYLDMVLYLFNSAKYNSVTYRVESYLWIDQPVYDTASMLIHNMLRASGVGSEHNMTWQVLPSIKCEMLLHSKMYAFSSVYKTDLYNISKVRSFVYTSLPTFAVHNIDMVARPVIFSLYTHDSPLDETESVEAVKLAVDTCLPHNIPLVTTGGNAGPVAPQWDSTRYFDFAGSIGARTVFVTEINVRGMFCPSLEQLRCMSKYVGALADTKGVDCVSSMRLFFTSHDRVHVSADFQQYVEQIREFDTEIRLEHVGQCSDVVYVQHKVSSTAYVDVTQKQQTLSKLHGDYHRQFGSSVLLDSGMHTLATYNVTMPTNTGVVSNDKQIEVSVKQAAVLRQQHENVANMVGALNLLGVPMLPHEVAAQSTMNLREESVMADSAGQHVIFSLVGGVISQRDAVNLVNNTFWLATSRFANTSDMELVGMFSTITGTLYFDALSIAQSTSLCQTVEELKTYVDTAALQWRARVTQHIVIRDDMKESGVRLQERMQSWIAASTYTMRISVIIPVEASMLNALLLEVMKSVIFNKASLAGVRLVSTSTVVRFVPPALAVTGADDDERVAVACTRVVYELEVSSMQTCTLAKTTNTEDYYAELMSVVSGLFAVQFAVEILAACQVTNTLFATLLHSEGETCTAPNVCSNNSIGYTSFLHEFANASNDNTYAESCVLSTELAVNARFDHLRDVLVDVLHVRDMQKTLMFGSKMPLLVVTLATFRVPSDLVRTLDLVTVFTNLYAPVQYTGGNSSSSSSMIVGESALYPRRGPNASTTFTLYTFGMSADEKQKCQSEYLVSEQKACVRNLSVSIVPEDATCMEIVATNSRIDIDGLKRLIFTKTTAEMRQNQNTAVSIRSVLQANLQRIECRFGVHTLVNALIQDYPQTIRLTVHEQYMTQHSVVVQHTTPFVHIPEYVDSVMRLVVATHNVQPGVSRMTTTAKLHLHTKGITHSTAVAFFGIMLQEYVLTQMLHDTNIRLDIMHIQRLQQYTPSFPGFLFDVDESQEQLYILVSVYNMRECVEIQHIVAQRVIDKMIYGMRIQITIIDTVATPVTCENMIYLEYNSVLCAQNLPNTLPTSLPARVSGGMLLSNNASCFSRQDADAKECTAQLSASDVGLFFATLKLLTAQLDPMSYHFKHAVIVCGLDMRLLRPLIFTPLLDSYGMCME